MNPKKQHEVERMCDQVHRLCGNHGCSDVIDVGSGLVRHLVDVPAVKWFGFVVRYILVLRLVV